MAKRIRSPKYASLGGKFNLAAGAICFAILYLVAARTGSLLENKSEPASQELLEQFEKQQAFSTEPENALDDLQKEHNAPKKSSGVTSSKSPMATSLPETEPRYVLGGTVLHSLESYSRTRSTGDAIFTVVDEDAFRHEDSLSALAVAKKQKVFGLGLSQTGTASLGGAFEKLGFKNIHNDNRLVQFLNPVSNFSWRIYDNVNSVEDLPTALYYKEVAAAYPNSKFVLTIRSEQAWFGSINKSVAARKQLNGGVLPFRVKELHKKAYGSFEPDRDLWIKNYRQHNERVMATFSKERLLVMNVVEKGQGYKELCLFLGITHGVCNGSGSAFPYKSDTLYSTEIAEETKSQQRCNQTNLKGFAYVVHLTEPSDPSRRPYFISMLILLKSLRETGNNYDFVFMYAGVLDTFDRETVLSYERVVIRPTGIFPSTAADVDEGKGQILVQMLNMLKLAEYEKAIFIDVDIVVLEPLHDLFRYTFLAARGSISPLNSGFVVFEPSCQAYIDLYDVSLTGAWTLENGWMGVGHFDWPTKGPSNWDFYCSSADQGLLWYYYFVRDPTLSSTSVPMRAIEGKYFTHFFGDNKPWLVPRDKIKDMPKRYRAGANAWIRLKAELIQEHPYLLNAVKAR